ncbi:MAG: hypothetical protein ACOZNI_15220 [Myxococcota bacterium]
MTDTAPLLAALERHREVRGSLPLYDALVRDDPDAVADALGDAPRHPLRPDVEAWLRARGVEPAGDDPEREELRARLAAAERHARDLQRRLDEAVAARAGAVRTADAAALVGVLLAAVAIAGWLAAFGVLPFSPERAPPVPTEQEPP